VLCLAAPGQLVGRLQHRGAPLGPGCTTTSPCAWQGLGQGYGRKCYVLLILLCTRPALKCTLPCHPPMRLSCRACRDPPQTRPFPAPIICSELDYICENHFGCVHRDAVAPPPSAHVIGADSLVLLVQPGPSSHRNYRIFAHTVSWCTMPHPSTHMMGDGD
jgi:hypothetical protein